MLVFLQFCFSVCPESVVDESFQYNVFYDGSLFLLYVGLLGACFVLIVKPDCGPAVRDYSLLLCVCR